MKPDKLYLRYGLFIAVGLIAYFLILKLIGWHQYIWLRLFNGAIVAYGIYAVIRLRRILEGDTFDYYKGFKTGIMAGFLATLVFTFFMAIYMYHIDPNFPGTIMDSWIKDYNQGPGILIFILLIEGFASTVVLTLAFMQKFKPSWNTKKTIQKA
ncbi:MULTISPECIES: DUF4199 domain-containing protein [Galbibacter]|uniref:DUF4199 domain-containing protein n=1 Tax=Galbibacter pacificus TaxID=2996052 RepID=A0ABT6FSP3_9FLAO|nr:DUF4199 domain-containing protein [Galbibacter pacificus]MDG3582593.1 DUF4199 domain-containing protein [Galbibacter pacificus]MDG3586288.1 DUF4199 domain-containing protein [Galbibacter pacificus]